MATARTATPASTSTTVATTNRVHNLTKNGMNSKNANKMVRTPTNPIMKSKTIKLKKKIFQDSILNGLHQIQTIQMYPQQQTIQFLFLQVDHVKQ